MKLINLNNQMYAYVIYEIAAEVNDEIQQIVLPLSIKFEQDLDTQLNAVVKQIAAIVEPNEPFLLGVPGASVAAMKLGVKLAAIFSNVKLLLIRKVGSDLQYNGMVNLG